MNLEEITNLAKSKGIRTIDNNTWATPLFQKPITKGIDVVDSASKYLGGHSDVLGGAIVTSKKNMKTIFKKEYLLLGGVMPPSEAALYLGLRTLPFRMLEHQENAFNVAEFLENHPKVERVNFPGLESHPDYHLGKSQLTGYSGLMSIELKEAHFNRKNSD